VEAGRREVVGERASARVLSFQLQPSANSDLEPPLSSRIGKAAQILSVPHGAPQCQHLICVEGGAPSAQSKRMPGTSQFAQTILILDAELVFASLV
jgi:hypothetical protein